ncbi:Bax inhibitor-1/YccA family protein [Nitrosomonas sp.]|uniref:Bax inhibitor-1/YccA family protein n=1 Tax=Nitrosomonas sp. TaxID=42353 RepID=UPI001D68EEDD|nr:Bax inhibitor-1/YccA family protein [Nitrosomonas sp.]MCB1949809.1 Bax inhibitor-1/YccA family protein [Nitrosomonas sp.]MCP5242863.1 Bax inhibitor-1/YccA family protein [Burkholderiales bacterium]MDR4514383.1 Bax inhibitor-1/YccA family protein [Nitrosomonas sp.]
MDQNYSTIGRSSRTRQAIEINKVLRNTYLLLAMTLLFSGFTAAISMMMNMPPMTYLLSVIGGMVIAMFVLPRFAHSSAGIGIVFLITGLLGFGLGPILSMYASVPNGSNIIMLSLGGTGVIFMGLSAYVLATRKDFSFLGGFLMVGFLLVLVAAVANIFLAIPAMSLMISAVVIMLMSGFILHDTSRIIHGGETNYILATIGLYMTIFNIFISLLQILGIMGGDD